MAALKSPNEWFSAGRIKACHLMPYFSSAIMGLVPYAVEGYGTLGVSARAVLVWDPALSKTWTVEHLAWVLLHEVGHYMREHARRRELALKVGRESPGIPATGLVTPLRAPVFRSTVTIWLGSSSAVRFG